MLRKRLLRIVVLAAAMLLLMSQLVPHRSKLFHHHWPDPQQQPAVEQRICAAAQSQAAAGDSNDVKVKAGNVKDALPSVCSSTDCGRKFLEKYTTPGHYRVPKIRHILWKSTKASNYLLKHLKSWYSVHPNWTYVLWQDSDLHPFVRKYFPGKIWNKFKSLGMRSIQRIDMFRYLLLYKFGGVYADMDTLVNSLDEYRRYPALITREAEVQAVGVFGLKKWPLPLITSPAFMMSEPGHSFFQFCSQQLCDRNAAGFMTFGGPFGLGDMVKKFEDLHKLMLHTSSFVYIPPSFSFYPYITSRLSDSKHREVPKVRRSLVKACEEKGRSNVPQVAAFCKDVEKLDALTDNTQPVVAMHDMTKSISTYIDANAKEFTADMRDMLKEVPHITLGSTLI